MDTLYDKVKKWLAANSKPRHMAHFERTAYWVGQLKPGADEAMFIAALAHDAERVFRDKATKHAGAYIREPEYLHAHQEGGAKMAGEFLGRSGADEALIERVKMLISKHEEGGTQDQNVIMDADSISFFENNVDHFANDLMKIYGKDKTVEKFKWMYSRMSSARAQEIAKDWYDRALRLVGEK